MKSEWKRLKARKTAKKKGKKKGTCGPAGMKPAALPLGMEPGDGLVFKGGEPVRQKQRGRDMRSRQTSNQQWNRRATSKPPGATGRPLTAAEQNQRRNAAQASANRRRKLMGAQKAVHDAEAAAKNKGKGEQPLTGAEVEAKRRRSSISAPKIPDHTKQLERMHRAMEEQRAIGMTPAEFADTVRRANEMTGLKVSTSGKTAEVTLSSGKKLKLERE